MRLAGFRPSLPIGCQTLVSNFDCCECIPGFQNHPTTLVENTVREYLRGYLQYVVCVLLNSVLFVMILSSSFDEGRWRGHILPVILKIVHGYPRHDRYRHHGD